MYKTISVVNDQGSWIEIADKIVCSISTWHWIFIVIAAVLIGAFVLAMWCLLRSSGTANTIQSQRITYDINNRTSATATRMLLHEIRLERIRQEEKWGEQNHSPFAWMSILGEEYGEACKAANEAMFFGYPSSGNLRPLREELIQVAAVAVAVAECIDRHGHIVTPKRDFKKWDW